MILIIRIELYMKQKMIESIFAFFFLLTNIFAQNNIAVKVTPLDKPEGEYGYIGFKITAPWMDGSILMRFPETLQAENGLYFIDHDRTNMRPLSNIKDYPDWKVDKVTGEISYSYTTPEGIEFGGFAKPDNDEVHLEYYVNNHTDKPVSKITPQMCLTLKGSNDFNQLNVTSDVFIWSDGEYFSLGKSTPTVKEIGRDPLLVISREGFADFKPGTDLGQWWVINQTSDEDIIVRESKDKKHLVAVTWPGDASFLIYNALIPCIHGGPTIKYTIDPNRERHWYGTIYLMDNKPKKLFERYKNGQRYN